MKTSQWVYGLLNMTLTILILNVIVKKRKLRVYLEMIRQLYIIAFSPRNRCTEYTAAHKHSNCDKIQNMIQNILLIGEHNILYTLYSKGQITLLYY